jgi:pilus assembly protein CpaF
MESDVVTLSDIFRFDQSGVSIDGKIEGMLRPTGIRPMFSLRLEAVGYKLRGEIFGAGKSWQ